MLKGCGEEGHDEVLLPSQNPFTVRLIGYDTRRFNCGGREVRGWAFKVGSGAVERVRMREWKRNVGCWWRLMVEWWKGEMVREEE